MPLTRMTIARDNGIGPQLDDLLHTAAAELVPAGMNSEQGPLTPGSIVFMTADGDRAWLTVDVFVEIEAYDYEDRRDLGERAERIGEAFQLLFPHVTFAVWPKLVTAGWWRETPDPFFDGSMTMEAAISRAWTALRRVDVSNQFVCPNPPYAPAGSSRP